MKAAQRCQFGIHPSLGRESRTAQVLASGLQNSANDHDDAANGDRNLAAKVIGEDGTVETWVSIVSSQTRTTGADWKVTYTIGMETKLPIWYRAPSRPSMEP